MPCSISSDLVENYVEKRESRKNRRSVGGGLGEGGELGERTGGRISINASSTYSVSTT